jgi:ATP-dependent Clp protease ATP-binding subunit ClpA
MVGQLEKRLREKDITLEVDVAVRSLLTEEGYDPVYGARPLRRAVMRLLEDTLAQQCLTKPLYPKTRLIVKREKRDGSLVDYTNEVLVEIDYSDVDPELLNSSENSLEPNELENISSENS